MDDNNIPNEPDEPDKLDEMEAILQQYHKSFEQEFAAIQSGNLNELTQKVREKFSNELLNLADTILDVATNGESDSVRLSAAKFAVTFILGQSTAPATVDDEMAKLLKRMTKKEKETSEQ